MKDAIPARDLRKKTGGIKRLRARGFDLIFRPKGSSSPRLAVIIKRSYGKAVERNKARRRLREIFRKSKAWLPEEFDIIVIVYPEFKGLSFQEISEEWINTLRRGGIVE